MRVVYDTNVLVSAALKPGSTPAVLVALALAQRVHLCVSPPILTEYKEVLHRPKFGFRGPSIDTLLEDPHGPAGSPHHASYGGSG